MKALGVKFFETVYIIDILVPTLILNIQVALLSQRGRAMLRVCL